MGDHFCIAYIQLLNRFSGNEFYIGQLSIPMQMLMSVHWAFTTVPEILSVRMWLDHFNVPVIMDSVEAIVVSHQFYHTSII